MKLLYLIIVIVFTYEVTTDGLSKNTSKNFWIFSSLIVTKPSLNSRIGLVNKDIEQETHLIID